MVKRIIISSNNNPDYINYWPLAAHCWQRDTDFIPTLFFIGDKKDFKFDEIKNTEIYFIKPIPDFPTSRQSQLIRIFIPLLFPEDVCLLTDIDLIPLKMKYFKKHMNATNNNLLSLTADAYLKQPWRYPMVYMCGKGLTFSSVLNLKINHLDDLDKNMKIFNRLIKYFYSLNFFKVTDEFIFSTYIHHWKYKKRRFKKFRRNVHPKIEKIETRIPTRLHLNRNNCNVKLLKENYYIDVILPLNFKNNYKKIIPILNYVKHKEKATNYGNYSTLKLKGKPIKYFILPKHKITKILNPL